MFAYRVAQFSSWWFSSCDVIHLS